MKWSYFVDGPFFSKGFYRTLAAHRVLYNILDLQPLIHQLIFHVVSLRHLWNNRRVIEGWHRTLRTSPSLLKYASKCVTLIVRFWNIFANSHLMDVISIVVNSKHYVDNFQSVFDAKTTKFRMKKECGKFDDFWKTISTKGTIHNIISLNIMSGKGHYTLF